MHTVDWQLRKITITMTLITIIFRVMFASVWKYNSFASRFATAFRRLRFPCRILKTDSARRAGTRPIEPRDFVARLEPKSSFREMEANEKICILMKNVHYNYKIIKY